MQKVVPFLWFDEQAEEAVHLYTSIFKDAKVGAVSRSGDDVPGPKGKVMTISFELAGREFMALNGGPEFHFTPSISFFVFCQTAKDVDALYDVLSKGGNVMMELGEYPFSQRYAWVEDRYGVSWQLILAGQPQAIVPCLMFAGEQHRKAEEAMQLYTSLFKNSSIDQVERYGKDVPEAEGAVVHGRFCLDGQDYVAMDSHIVHNFTITPAISFFVHCHDQEEVDYFWEKLSEGGEKGPCGWLTDRYGISWQIVPTILGELMSSPDAEKAHRVTQAMLKMSKLDINQLQQAYEQG